MIFIDTSVWIDFFRGKDSALILDLQALLDNDQVAMAYPVRCEILSGSSKGDYETLRLLLSALPIFYPTENTWALVDLALTKAVKRNEHFGFSDLLIATLAKEQNFELWTRDHDFDQMAELGLVNLFTAGAG